MDAALEQLVPRRARFRCEHCLLPEALVSTPFQFDHLIAPSHGGSIFQAAYLLHTSCFGRPDDLVHLDLETDRHGIGDDFLRQFAA